MPENFEIPIENLNGDSSLKIRTVLEDVELVLKLDWNTRKERWMISIYDAQETPLRVRLPLHVDTEFLTRFEVDGLPPGQLLLYDTSQMNVEAAFDDLGDRCRLFYLESE